jgi:hypothetical protein
MGPDVPYEDVGKVDRSSASALLRRRGRRARIERVDELQRAIRFAIEVGLESIDGDRIHPDVQIPLPEENALHESERCDPGGYAFRDNDGRPVDRGHGQVHPTDAEDA